MAVTQAQLEQLYLAYFGRPADFDGLAFYTSKPNLTIWDVAASFSASPESQALYGAGFNASVINAIYQNLFNRDAEPAGLLYWSQQVASGALSPAGAALGILLGAQNADLTSVQNKLAAATLFTNHLDTSAEIIGYAGTDAAATARAYLHTVTSDPASLTAATAGVDAAIAGTVAVGGTIGQTVSLTSNVDTIDFSKSGQTIDTVKGIVSLTGGVFPFIPPTDKSTLSTGDTINGNGKTIVDVAVASSGTADFVTISNVSKVNITAAVSNTNMKFDATTWKNIGSVNLASGANGLDVKFDHLQAGTGLTISNVQGSLSAVYTNGVYAYMSVDNGPGTIGNVGNKVVGTAGANATVGYSQSATTSNIAQTVGDITITGSGAKEIWVSVSNTQSKGGDITVGNVSETGAKSVYFSITNTSHTKASAAVNTTVGNVTVANSAKGGIASISISQTGYAHVGNVTTGNLSATAVAGAHADIYVYNKAFGNSQSVDASTGNTKVGDVNLVAGAVATANEASYLSVTQYATATGTNAATTGTVTVGNVTMNLGAGVAGTASVQSYMRGIIQNTASAAGGAATAGNVSVGSITATLGATATMTMDVTLDAQSVGGAATAGSLTVGNASYTIATDANVVTNVVAKAIATSTAAVGDVNVGNISVTGGIGSNYVGVIAVSAMGSTGSSTGAVTIGNVTLNGDDGAVLSQRNQVNSSGTAGAVGIGAESATLGVQASVQFINTVKAAGGTDTVMLGATTIDASKKNAVFHVTSSVTSTGGDVGAVSAGNVTLSIGAGQAATDKLTISAVAGAVGAVSLGDVSTTVIGKSAAMHITDTISGLDSIGAVSMGNVSLSAKGTGALNQLKLAEGTATAGATMTIGNVSLTVTGSAGHAGGAQVNATFDNASGAVKVGNVTISANGVQSTATSSLMTYDANLNISASKSVTIGNITVSGGDGHADSFNNLATGVLNGVTAGSGGITIGNVDYSGYGAKATIDVSGYKGAAVVIGSAKDDVITDNKAQNTLTGGAGKDTFTFVSTNTGLTAATADVVTDFSNAGGDKIKVGLPVPLDPNTNYAEETAVDFATFLKDAGTANKEIFAAQVGSDVWVAVDVHDAANVAGVDGTVDYVIKLTGVSLSGIDVASFV